MAAGKTTTENPFKQKCVHIQKQNAYPYMASLISTFVFLLQIGQYLDNSFRNLRKKQK